MLICVTWNRLRQQVSREVKVRGVSGSGIHGGGRWAFLDVPKSHHRLIGPPPGPNPRLKINQATHPPTQTEFPNHIHTQPSRLTTGKSTSCAPCRTRTTGKSALQCTSNAYAHSTRWVGAVDTAEGAEDVRERGAGLDRSNVFANNLGGEGMKHEISGEREGDMGPEPTKRDLLPLLRRE